VTICPTSFQKPPPIELSSNVGDGRDQAAAFYNFYSFTEFHIEDHLRQLVLAIETASGFLGGSTHSNAGKKVRISTNVYNIAGETPQLVLRRPGATFELHCAAHRSPINKGSWLSETSFLDSSRKVENSTNLKATVLRIIQQQSPTNLPVEITHA
jgi:hypothetical protein